MSSHGLYQSIGGAGCCSGWAMSCCYEAGRDMPTSSLREAVGVFQSEHALQLAADELHISGFDRADLSLLADARTVEQKLGHAYRCMTEIEDDPTVPKRAYAGSESRTEIGRAHG